MGEIDWDSLPVVEAGAAANDTGEIDWENLPVMDGRQAALSPAAQSAQETAQMAQAAQPAPRKMTQKERIVQNQRAIARAQQPDDGEMGFWDATKEALSEGVKGGARAAKAIGQGVLGTVTSAVRLAGTPVRMATGWDGIHKLADKIDSSYENFGRDALMSEYGENPDGWGYALGRAGEKVAGVAGSLAGLGGAGKVVGVAGKALKTANYAKTAKAVENLLPAMFGNDAAVRAYDTARENHKSKAEAAALAGLNGAIHFTFFKMFENQSLKKMLNIGPEVEVMMPKWANALADGGGQSFSSLVRGTRNGMVKYIAAENGKRALKAGGIMGLQDMLSDPVMQVAEGADIDDIDFSRMLKAGAHGVGEGALMEGLMGGAAIFKSQKAAEKFMADKYFRGKKYKVMGADGKMHKEDGLLESPQGRMMLMKQNPDATTRVLDIVDHGGKPRPEELDAAFLPPDMTTDELRKFHDDWRKDLLNNMGIDPDAQPTLRLGYQINVGERPPSQEWQGAENPGIAFDELVRRGTAGQGRPETSPETTTQERPNETGNRADEAPARPEQGAVQQPQEGEVGKTETAEPPRAEANDEGVVGPSKTDGGSQNLTPTQPAESPAAAAPSAATPAQPAEKPSTTAPKPPEAQTPAESAKPVEAPSRPSDATLAVSAPDKASDAQKAALAKLGEGEGVAVTSAKMGKGGVLRVKYTMPSADGRVVEFDSTIDAEGKTSTSVAGVKAAPAPAAQTGEVTSPETPAPTPAPATQAQTNIPNEKKTSPAPAPKSNRLRRADGTDPLAEREQAASATQSPESSTPSGAEAPEPISPAVRKHRADRLRSLLDFVRNEDGSFNPDALRNHDGNNGLPLKDLKLLNEHPEIVDDLRLPAEDATALRDAVEVAYIESVVGNKSGGGSQRAATAMRYLRTRPNDLRALAKAQAALKYAHEKALNDGKNENAEMIADVLRPLNERINALDPRKQQSILKMIHDEEQNLTNMERKNRVGLVNAEGEDIDVEDTQIADVRRGGKVASDLNKGLKDVEAARVDDEVVKNDPGEALAEKFLGMLGASTDKNAKLTATANGKNITFTWHGHRNARTGELEDLSVTKSGKEVLDALWPKDEMGKKKRLSKDEKQEIEWARNVIKELTSGRERDVRESKSDAADLPDAWTSETQKPLENFANKVLKPTGLVKDFEFVPRPEKVDGANAITRKDGTVVGEYDRETGKARFFPGARPEDITHEFTHGLFQHAESEAAAGRPKLKETIDKLVKAMPKVWRDAVGEKYADRPAAEVLEEIFTNGLARLGETGVKGIDAKTGEIIPGKEGSGAMAKAMRTLEGKAWYNRAWNAIKELYRDFMRRHGWYNARLDKLDRMSPEEAARHILSEMAKGRSFGDAKTGGEGKRIAMADSPSAEGQGGVRESRRVVLPKPPTPPPKINMSKNESLKEKYLRNMSDRYDPLKRLVEEAKESAAKPSDVPDPYHEKRVQSGHNEADRHQIDILKNKYVDFLKRHSHGQKEQEKLHEEVNMYLRARDALYRNPEMKKRLGVDDGSGMSDAQAHKILDDFKRRMRTPILDQAFKIMQEVKKTYGLQRLVDGGMLDQATADMLEKRNPDYAPQRTSRLDEEGIDRNSTRNMEAAAIKKALGRSTLSDNPVEFLFLQASDAAARTNENRTRQEMAKFVRMFPEVGKVRVVNKTSAYDPKTGKDAWIEDPHDVESENPLVVSFRENGKRMRIEFADTPRGRLLAESMRNEGVNRGPEAFDRMTRAWASTATQLSATFSGRNFQKDTVEVALNSAADTGFSGAGKFLKAQIAQMKPVVSTIREYLTKGTFGGPLGKEFKEFIDAGGSIGGMGREGYEDLKDTFSRKAKGLKMAFSGAHGVKEKVEAILGVTFGKIEDFNKTIEMMSRFNNYRSRRARGESEKEAVIGSREDSTDFNMYGQQRWLNDVYMFSNSILGGTLRSTKQLATGKNGWKVATAVLAYGFVEAAADVLRNQDDDDEAEKSGLGGAKDLSERERSQTLYFRYGGKYFRIPVHGGPFSALKYTGGLLARAALGKLSWSDAAKNAGKEWATIGTHFGGAGEIDLTNGPKGIVSSFTPSVARPVAELGMNQDFAGRHIYAPEGFDKTTPKSERGFKSTGDGYKWFARLMNKVGGGNESRSADWSWFDNPPEAYKHIVEAVGKNMIRDIMLGGETAGRAVESVAKGENRFTRDDVPFLRDVTRNVPDNSRRYYAALDDYERDKAEFKKTTDPKRRKELRADKPYLFAGKSLLDGQIDRVKELMHLERGEVKVGQKWVEPKIERTEEQKEKWRKQRLALQARILKRLGK